MVKKAFKLIKYTVFFIITACAGIFISGFIFTVAYLTIGELGMGEKDVSADFQRGHVVGNEYETLNDIYMAQLIHSDQLSATTHLDKAFRFEGEKKIEFDLYQLREIIPKGTRFRVCTVLVRTQFGHELCSQSVYADILNPEGHPIDLYNRKGSKVSLNVSYLFNGLHSLPNENWIFNPDREWLKEVNSIDSSDNSMPQNLGSQHDS